ncbi:MAG: MFS transporter [Opitutales bacterium]|nr:MFS transporter [Opitutales bacterium]
MPNKKTLHIEEPTWVDSLYDRLAEDDEGRVCTAISERACRATPGNFFLTLAANTLTSVGDRIASAKTTLPWILGQVGAPGWMVGMLVPIRESGSMLPQLMIGALIRRRAVRKWVWVGGSLVQGMSLLLMGLVAMKTEGLPSGLAIIGLLVFFSLARGACSVAYKDVLGKTIPKTRRGRLSGWIAAAGGLGALIVGLGLGQLSDSAPLSLYAGLLALAALLWLFAAAIYSRILEFPGETGGGANGFREGLDKLSLLREDRPFRLFVIGRTLAMGSGLAAPFYVTLARRDLGHAAALLGIFIVAEGLAGLISAPVWGRWADRSSRLVFAAACALSAVGSVAVAVWAWADLSVEAGRVFYPAAFFLLGLAHAGVRLGRKTYLVDMAEGNQRTDYVAVSNTVIGALLLAVGVMGALTAVLSVEAALVLLALAGFSGAALSLRWEEVSAKR